MTDKTVERAEAVTAFQDASRVLVAIAVSSVESAPVELTLTGHRILVLLSDHGPQRIGDLASLLDVHSSTATRHCDRLERAGLVTRRRSGEDGRAVEVLTTPRGRSVVASVMDTRRSAIGRVLDALPEQTVVGLAAAMRAFAAAFDTAEGR